MEIFLLEQPKEKVLSLLTLRCLELCLENSIPDGNYNDHRNAIEKRFISMEKDELLKLMDNESLLINILKNEIFKKECDYQRSLKNKTKKEVLAVVIENCMVLGLQHFNKKCSDDDLIRLKKTFNGITKANLLKLTDNNLLSILENKIFNQ